MDEKYWTNLENLFVHYVYDEISPCNNGDDEDNSIKSSNNNNNNRAWKKVRNFINELEPNSIIADIGCGNGKYLEINNSIYTVGCDICRNLVNIAADNQSTNKNQLVICDNLKLPFR
jgi:tRNA (uracil-5-)-methyltransferase TRM9